MKYVISPLPDTAKDKNFKMRSHPAKSESSFSISRSLLRVWGNPGKDQLERFMIAYIKRHGWSKTPLMIQSAGSPKNLNQYIASLDAAKKA